MTDTASARARVNARKQNRNEARVMAERKNTIKLLMVIMIGIFVLVGMRSYAAILQHENNVLIENNEYLQAEIDSLNSQIVEETKVTKLEELATDKYGMVFPSSENCVRLSADSEDAQDLAAVIRSEAYN